MNKLSVDFHSHILPCVDDGSSSFSETLEMLRLEAAMGIKTVIATPHFYADSDNPEDFFTRRSEAAEKVLAIVKDNPKFPRVLIGAEVLYFTGMERWDILPKLAIEGTKHILIEMSSASSIKKNINSLLSFKSKTGLTPIIAHIDRYISPYNTYNLPELLSSQDVLVQLNASAFLKFPKSVLANRLLKQGKVHLLGSDCHNLTTRSPNLDQACEVISRKLGESYISKLAEFEKQILCL